MIEILVKVRYVLVYTSFLGGNNMEDSYSAQQYKTSGKTRHSEIYNWEYI